jgi:hypothetical protein
MRVFRDPQAGQWKKDAVSFGIGAVGGLAFGMVISRALGGRLELGKELRERARTVGSRLRPGRLRRLAFEQAELDRLEDAVLNGFLDDAILRERGIDIGAISHGIIELSGSVWTDEEAQRAVAVANRIPGVRTVVNRLGLEDADRAATRRRRLDAEDRNATFAHQEGRVGGMGRRRQSTATEPDRPDDSQKLREEALAAADRDQLADEGITRRPRDEADAERQATQRVNFSEDELDNQDPHGQRVDLTLDAPPEELHPDSRVGEGQKPALRSRRADADLPIDEPTLRDHVD